MSYTFKKVIWEGCLRNDLRGDYLLEADGNYLTDSLDSILMAEIDDGSVYLADVDSKYLAEKLNAFLITKDISSKPTVNEFGDLVLNVFEDIEYPTIDMVRVRKQPHVDIIKTSEGRQVMSKSYFYIDPNVERNALNIGYMDKLDGETVVDIYVMCSLHNVPKLIRFTTV